MYIRDITIPSSVFLYFNQAFLVILTDLYNTLSYMCKYDYVNQGMIYWCFELMKINLNHTLTHS